MDRRPHNTRAQQVEARVAEQPPRPTQEHSDDGEGEGHRRAGAGDVEPQWHGQVVALPEAVSQRWVGGQPAPQGGKAQAQEDRW